MLDIFSQQLNVDPSGRDSVHVSILKQNRPQGIYFQEWLTPEFPNYLNVFALSQVYRSEGLIMWALIVGEPA